MMGIGTPDWDVAKVSRDYISNNWPSVGGTKPENIVLASNHKGVDFTQEYILVSETGERGRTYSDLQRNHYDADSVAFIEVATPESRSRREEMWDGMLQIGKEMRKRSASLPGNWDTMDVDGAPINDDAYNWWAMEITFAFNARSRKL